jgi:ribosomal protein L37AE/L43A
VPGMRFALREGMEDRTTKQPERKAGDQVKCPRCGKTLVLVKNRGLWACDPGTKRRHSCLDDRRVK